MRSFLSIVTGAMVVLMAVPALWAEDAASGSAIAGAVFADVSGKGETRFVPSLDEVKVPARFRMKAHSFPYETEFERNSGPVRVFKVRFSSPVKTEHPENNTVHGHYFQPSGKGPFPGVVFLHELGGLFPLSQAICNSLARNGIAALFIKLPYYGERHSPTARRYMVMTDPKLTVESMTQAVGDIRHAAAWLGERSEVDADQLGLGGISLGGIMTGLATPAEPRFRKAAIIVGGGNLAPTLWDHPHFVAKGFRKRWTEAGKSRESFYEILKPVDPITYAHLLKERDVLIVGAKHDEVIPPSSTLALWDAMDKKGEIVWLEAGHISAAKYLYGEVNRLVHFFAENNQ